jgi:short-subunit dehydrogenase
VKKAIIMGVGADQGLVAQLAKRFSSEGLHVFVASRTQSRLDALTVKLNKQGVKRLQSVQTLPTKDR